MNILKKYVKRKTSENSENPDNPIHGYPEFFRDY